MVLEQLQSIYGSKVVPVQYPLATGPNFNSLIDVLLMKKYSWGPEGGAPTIEDVPAEEMEKATAMHKALVEAAAEHDETLMEKFFEQDSLTEDARVSAKDWPAAACSPYSAYVRARIWVCAV